MKEHDELAQALHELESLDGEVKDMEDESRKDDEAVESAEESMRVEPQPEKEDDDPVSLPEETEPDEPDEAKRSVYSLDELSTGDVLQAISRVLKNAYESGFTRKQIRKRSGVKKKVIRRIEEMDMEARFGDVLKVLEATGHTLAVVPLKADTPVEFDPIEIDSESEE